MSKFDNTYQSLLNFSDEFFPNWRNQNPIFFSNALAGEVGEICNLTKKLNGGGTSISQNEISLHLKIREEIADSFIYLIHLWENLGFSRNEFLEMINIKIAINYQRMTIKDSD